jgi:AcrR family transcriptional regulator
VRRDLLEAALALFGTKGFSATSVDEISRRAGVSRSTFFRYFGSKEAILLGEDDEAGTLFVRCLAARPKDEGRMQALENALIDLNESIRSDERRDEFRARRDVIEADPALRLAQEAAGARWRHEIAGALAARDGRDDPNLEDALAAAILFEITQHIGESWFAGSGPSLSKLIRGHFETVRRVAAS